MTSDGVVDTTARSPLLANPGSSLKNPGSSLKRQRMNIPVKVEEGNNNELDLNRDPKPCLSNLWLDDNNLRVGLCFNDSDELKKAVNWYCINGQRRCVLLETNKDKFMSECLRWKCKWSLVAARMKNHGHLEIIKYSGPHTCDPLGADSDLEFGYEEIEPVVRVNPTLSFAELKKWCKKNTGFKLGISEVRYVKEEAMKRIFGDWDKSFEDLPKLMSALCSSNGLLVDWKYDRFPNPKFASFCAVFWAFPQSVEGFQHCKPLITVDTMCDHPLEVMIAFGEDANNKVYVLAFAVTKEVSTDTWRWFLSQIREKVTKREGICLISSPDPDILAVINEPGSLWQEPLVYHRFCLKLFSTKFNLSFPGDDDLTSLVKQAGWTSCKKEFEAHIETIRKKNPEARKWLDQFPQNKWALVHDNGRRYGTMVIQSLFEDYSGFELDHYAVTGCVLLLFDELRNHFDKQIRTSRRCLNRGDVYTKLVADKLEEFRTSSVTYKVIPLEDNVFQVKLENTEWTVQLSDCTCTCGEFQSRKVPCVHALAVCKKLKINPLQYVDDCYTVERLHKTYAATFYPVPELSAWPEAYGVPRLFPPDTSN